MIIENIRYDKCDLARSHVEVFFGMKAAQFLAEKTGPLKASVFSSLLEVRLV